MQPLRAMKQQHRPSLSSRRGITIWGLIGGVMFGGMFAAAGGLMIFFWAWPELQNGKASANWPDVPGKVIESEVVRSRDSDGDTQYKASVIYEYLVEEESYENDKVSFGGGWGSNLQGPARKVVKKYPVGTELSVYYDTDDPSNSVLEPGTTWFTYLPLGFASIFLLVGLAVLIPVIVMTLMTIVGLGVAVTKSTEDKNPYAADFNDHDRKERPAHDDGFDL